MSLLYMVTMGYWKTIYIDSTYNQCFSSLLPHPSPSHFPSFIFPPLIQEQDWTSRSSTKEVHLHFYANTEVSMNVTLVRDKANLSLNPGCASPVQTGRFRTKMAPLPGVSQQNSDRNETLLYILERNRLYSSYRETVAGPWRKCRR